MAPTAPMEWPWRLLVAEMGMWGAWSPKTLVDGGGFGGVVGEGAGAVGVDVADRLAGGESRASVSAALRWRAAGAGGLGWAG